MWQPGHYGYDPHVVSLLPGAPPGEYRVVVALFDKHTLAPASDLGAEGNPMGPELTLGTVRVTRPGQVAELSALDVPEDARRWRCGDLGLLKMTVDRERAAPGELIGVRWAWEALWSEGLLASENPGSSTPLPA